MPVAMATDKRLRVSFDADSEAIRRAIHVAASLQGRSHNEVLNDLVKEHLAKYVTLAEAEIREEEGESKPKKRKGDA